MASRYNAVAEDPADEHSAEDPEQDQREESEAERLDRNYDELLQELRVLQAGMQILFAFLLSLAFQQRFTSVTDLERDVYVITLVVASLATGCLLAPVAFHRMVFRRGMKAELMTAANRYVAAGLALLFLAMLGAVLLVLDFLVNLSFAIVVVLTVGAVFLVMWLGVPLIARARKPDDRQDEPASAL
jgi:Family of unknown function (DUF6328)